MLSDDHQRKVLRVASVVLCAGALGHAWMLGGVAVPEGVTLVGSLALLGLGQLSDKSATARRVGALLVGSAILFSVIALRGMTPAVGAIGPVLILLTGLLFGARIALAASFSVATVTVVIAGSMHLGVHQPEPALGTVPFLDPTSPWAWVTQALSFLAAAVGSAVVILHARRETDRAYQASIEALAQAEEEGARADQAAKARLSAETLLREAQKLQAVTHVSVGLKRLLGNALMITGGAIRRLKRTPTGAQAEQTARTVLAALEPLRAVLGGLLRLSRTGPGEAVRVHDLAQVVDEVAAELRPTLGRNVTLTTEPLGSPVLASETDLRRALVYVLQNAAEALPDGGHITVSLRHVRLRSTPSQAVSPLVEGDYIACSIRDDGTGMSPEHARRAFDAFFTTKPSREHLGTGLHAALQILKAHQGSIALESRKGRGTRVTFYLPRPVGNVSTHFAPTREQTHFGHEEEDATLSEPGLWAPAPIPTHASSRHERRSLSRVPPWADRSARSLGKALTAIIALGTTWRFLGPTPPPRMVLPVVAIALGSLLFALRPKTKAPVRAALVVFVPALFASAMLSVTSFLSASVIAGLLFSVTCGALLLGPFGAVTATLIGLIGFAVAGGLSLQGALVFNHTADALMAPDSLMRMGLTVGALLAGLTLSTVRVLDALGESIERTRRATQDAEHHAQEAAETNHHLITLARQQTRCERASTAGTLVGSVTHDLSNALQVLLNCAELLTLGADDQSFEATALQMERSVTYAEALSQQFAFDNSEAASQSPVDVTTETKRALDMVRTIMPEGIHIVEAVDDAGFVQLAGQDILRILFNLATNARDAMPEGGQLSVRLSYLAHDDAVQLRVADTGCGMDEATQQRAFDAFYTTKPTGMGTGLGLFTLHQILQRTHGRVQLHTAPGEGTTWEIRWPALTTAEVEAHHVEASGVRERGGQLLLVEPDDTLRALLTEAFEEQGYHVTSVADGDAARLALRDSTALDALITDSPIEGYPAPRLINAFRKRHPMRPVVLCSGHLSRDGVAWVERHAEVVFAQKPCRAGDLVHAIESAAVASGADAPPQRLLTLPPLDAAGA